jgi:hypothetical protein
MIKKLIMAGMMLFAVSMPTAALANGCDYVDNTGLPTSQIAELKKNCYKLAADAVTNAQQATQASNPVSAENLNQYAEIGQKYGIALAEAAKSIGTGVNEFAQTFVGKLLLVLVVWKVIGRDLLGITAGITWFVTMLPLWIYMFHRLVLGTRRIETKSTTDKAGVVTEITEMSPIDWSDGPGPIAIVMLIVLVCICICGFVIVF